MQLNDIEILVGIIVKGCLSLDYGSLLLYVLKLRMTVIQMGIVKPLVIKQMNTVSIFHEVDRSHKSNLENDNDSERCKPISTKNKYRSGTPYSYTVNTEKWIVRCFCFSL